MFETERTQEEVERQWGEAAETRSNPRWRGMSYEDGVMATLDWLTGDREEPPMEG